MATIAERLRKAVKPVRGSDKFKFQNPNRPAHRPAHRAGLERRTALQKALTQRQGAQGGQRVRQASRTAQPQPMKGQAPLASRVKSLLQTGKVGKARRMGRTA